MDKETTDRFWAKVDKKGPGECWPWSGSPYAAKYYGAFRIDSSRTVVAHRFALETKIGKIPDGLYALHSRACTTKKCCNPGHLRAGTHQENMEDYSGRSHLEHPKQVPVRVEEDLHRRLKVRVAESGTTIQDFMLKALEDKLSWEEIGPETVIGRSDLVRDQRGCRTDAVDRPLFDGWQVRRVKT